MRSSTWEVIASLAKRYESQIPEPVPIVEIEAAERALSVKFDPDYSEFVRRFGSAQLGYYPLFGLRPVNLLDSHWSVVEWTTKFQDFLKGRGLDWYVLSDENGNPIGQSRDHRVWAYYFDAQPAFDPVRCIAKDFADFVERICLELPIEP